MSFLMNVFWPFLHILGSIIRNNFRDIPQSIDHKLWNV